MVMSLKVHERSIETDLVLVSLRELLKTKKGQKIKVVLMSATANAVMYERYFNENKR